MGLTEAEKQAIADAQTEEEALALLQGYFNAGKITEDAANTLMDTYFPVQQTPSATTTTLQKAATVGLTNQTATGQAILDSLEGYTSEHTQGDPTSLARLIANLIAQGKIKDVVAGGALYNRILGKTVDFDTPQAALDQSAQMVIRQGLALNAASSGKQTEAKNRLDAALGTMDTGVLETWLKSQGLWTQADERAKQSGIAGAAGTAADLALTRIKLARTLPELQQYLTDALSNKNITEEQYAQLYGIYAPDIVATAERTQKNADITTLNSFTIAENKRNYLPGLKAYLDSGVSNGSLTQEQANSQFNLESTYLDKGYGLQDLPNYTSLKAMGAIQTPESRLGEEAQAKVDIINQGNVSDKGIPGRAAARLAETFKVSEQAGTAQVLDEIRRRNVVTKAENAIPAQPSYVSSYEPYLATLPENLRAFVEREFLPRIAESTAGAREAWWAAKNPVAPMAEPAAAPVPTYQSLLGNAQSDVSMRADVLRSAQLGASTGANQEYNLGQLPYATEQQTLSQKRLGDLLNLGQEGYYAQQRALLPTGVAAPNTPRQPTTAEDPFLTELKRYGTEGKFLSEFLAQSPSERGYNKRLFAPRLSKVGY